MNKKIIIFEELRIIHRWLIDWYLWCKYEVKYARMSREAEAAQFTQLYAGRIEKVSYEPKPTTHDGYFYDDAFEAIDAFFQDFQNKSIFESMVRLYKNDAVILAYKKAFNDILARFYYLNHFMHTMVQRYEGDGVAFIPSNGIRDYRTESCEIYDYNKVYRKALTIDVLCYATDSIRFPWWCIIGSCISAFIRKCKILGMLSAFPGWCFWKSIKAFWKKHPLKERHFKYAMTVVSPARQFANKIQTVDFLIDGEMIKKEDAVFHSYSKLSKNEQEYLARRQLTFFDDSEAFISFSEIGRIIPAYLLLIFSIFKENSTTLKTSLKGLYFYVIWDSLARNIKFDNYITYSIYEIKSIFRNIVFEAHGCTTYQFMDSTNFGYFFTNTKTKGKKSFLLGFLYGDYLIVWNDEIINFLKFVHCQFEHYVNLGCFWSEHVRMISEREIKMTISEKLESSNYRPGMMIISVFDSTASDDAHTTYSDAIGFLQGIYSLMQDIPDAFFVLKEKNLRSYHKVMSAKYQEINALYEKFDDFTRCLVIGKKANPSEIIAMSDLTISSPFTSTTFEAVSARKKALWYDASGKFRQSYYDNVPGLVCHTYEELLTRVKDLLFETSDEKYGHYLETHIKGKIESYLDGKAITRFRTLLDNPDEAFECDVNDSMVIAKNI